ncbi:lipoprotein [Paractinoplanes abujensis]|uniref:ABC transporter n=1 Tax=Paractinoplanes abujensis TaxID=882441 RepID=A0A7W7FZD8_9ACTN|nr:hypothetical protein [Actinoplanes abujensis]MBB4689995.1 hypothetical protein [Actinoplanes abujensis]GID20768.1 lipoprotein [Actinoplanes abujensis]
MLSLVVAVAGCASGEEAAEVKPHGYVAGAAELPEAQVAIAYAARGARELSLLDLATGEEKRVGLAIGVETLTEDGRFVYAGDGERTVQIVDTGVWTVDHTDHVHYYRAPARTVGSVVLDAPVASVVGSEAHTAIGTADGRVTVLDRRKLADGVLSEVGTVDSGSATGLAVPYGETLLVAVGDQRNRAADRIVAMGFDGRATDGLDVPCVQPQGAAVLRGGVVFACQGSVVRVKNDEAEVLGAEGKRVTGFGFRPRSNEAATAHSGGIWSVNASKATLRQLPVGGRKLMAAVSPADGRSVLALDDAGTLVSYDLTTGRTIAEAPLRAATVMLDINRAYVTQPQAQAIVEIDYRDRLRTARTFSASQRPDLAVEVGR